MYKEIYLEIPGIPQAKESVRQGFKGRFYNPSKKMMDQVKLYIKSVYKGEILKGPLHAIFLFEMPIPESWSDKKKILAIRGDIPHIVKPDTSNMLKFYEDCMSKIIYKDDAQIIKLDPVKYYSTNPRTRIWIIPL